MANANVDAEKIVFLVDIVRFFMERHYPDMKFEFGPRITSIVGDYRPHVPQHFSENLKQIMKEIDDTQGFIVKRDFLEMESKGISISTLVEYMNAFINANQDERFSAANFLMLCARASLMSCFCFATGRKYLNHVVDLLTTYFPYGEDECRLLWDEIDNAAESHGSNSEGNAISSVFGREPSQSEVSTGDGGKVNTQKNATFFSSGRLVLEIADVSSGAEASNESNSEESSTSPVFDNKRRETADIVSSGTEDSCSSSSTTHTDSGNTPNTQDMKPVSSNESLTKLIVNFNEMASIQGTNNPESTPVAATSDTECLKYHECEQSTTTSGAKTVHYVECNQSITAAATSGMETVDYVECKQSTTAAATSGMETVDYVECKQSTTAATSGTETVVHVECKQSTTAAATSGMETVDYVECKQSTTAADTSGMETVDYVECKQSTTAAATSGMETVDYDECKQSTTAATSGTETVVHVECKQNTTAAVFTEFMEYDESNQGTCTTDVAASSTIAVKVLENEQRVPEAAPTENLGSTIQDTAVSSSKCPKLVIDFKSIMEKAFMEVESAQKSPTDSAKLSPTKSPSKSPLGKRSSPRLDVSFSKDKDETEIKKLKLESPENRD